VKYQRRNRKIEIRRDSLQGLVLLSLDDSSATGVEIYEIVMNL
jgi:hypothetical protein